MKRGIDMEDMSISKRNTLITQIKNGETERIDKGTEYDVPDYIGDISKVLFYNSSLNITNEYKSDGLCKFEGDVVFSVMLQSEDESINCVNIVNGFSGEIGFENSADVKLDYVIENDSVKAVNKRKLSCKCTVAVHSALHNTINSEIDVKNNTEDASLQVLSGDIKTLKEHFGVEDEIECRYNIELDSNYPEIGRIIFCDVKPCVTDIRAGVDSVNIRGVNNITVLFSDVNGEIYSYRKKDELNETVNCIGCASDMGCRCNVHVKEIDAISQTNSFGEEKNIELVYKSQISAVAAENIYANACSDAFSPKYDISIEKDNINSSVYSDMLFGNFTFSQSKPYGGENAECEAVYYESKAKITSFGQNDNKKVIIEGLAIFNVLLKSNGRIEAQREEFPFKYETNIESDKELEPFVSVGVICENVRFDNDKISYEAEISINGYFTETENHEIVKTVNFNEEKTRNNDYLTLYYPDGESLWDIAKANGVASEKILIANDCDEKTLIERNVIIIPSNF